MILNNALINFLTALLSYSSLKSIVQWLLAFSDLCIHYYHDQFLKRFYLCDYLLVTPPPHPPKVLGNH